MYVNVLCCSRHLCSCLCLHLSIIIHVLSFLIDVTVCYENETYSVEEEAGVVTLALVLKGETTIPVTVNVTTLDLLNSSVGDAATGEL